jgi:hypothetical protein
MVSAFKLLRVSIRTRSVERVMHLEAGLWEYPAGVSIRTRSVERVMHDFLSVARFVSSFNPHPLRRAGDAAPL